MKREIDDNMNYAKDCTLYWFLFGTGWSITGSIGTRKEHWICKHYIPSKKCNGA